MIFSKLIKTNINKSSNEITRTEIINYLNKKYSYKTYLEIGVNNPKENFNKIKIKYKDGVDPKWKRNPRTGNKYEMESDQFFKEIKETKKYDLIFIDGLHTYGQTKKDIKNSLKHLSEEGTIIIHDCNPKTEWHQRGIEDFHDGEEWNGTTWKAFIELRCTNSHLSMYTIDKDCGCGIIKYGKQKLYRQADLKTCLEWKYFETNKKELLKLISINEFFDKY